MDAVDIVSSAVLGVDVQTIPIGNKVYLAHPPTIRKIVGAGRFLGGFEKIDSAKSLLEALNSDNLAHALSWLLEGNDSLAEEFKDADVNELALGTVTCLDMLTPQNFMTLSVLARNVRKLIARQKS